MDEGINTEKKEIKVTTKSVEVKTQKKKKIKISEEKNNSNIIKMILQEKMETMILAIHKTIINEEEQIDTYNKSIASLFQTAIRKISYIFMQTKNAWDSVFTITDENFNTKKNMPSQESTIPVSTLNILGALSRCNPFIMIIISLLCLIGFTITSFFLDHNSPNVIKLNDYSNDIEFMDSTGESAERSYDQILDDLILDNPFIDDARLPNRLRAIIELREQKEREALQRARELEALQRAAREQEALEALRAQQSYVYMIKKSIIYTGRTMWQILMYIPNQKEALRTQTLNYVENYVDTVKKAVVTFFPFLRLKERTTLTQAEIDHIRFIKAHPKKQSNISMGSRTSFHRPPRSFGRPLLFRLFSPDPKVPEVLPRANKTSPVCSHVAPPRPANPVRPLAPMNKKKPEMEIPVLKRLFPSRPSIGLLGALGIPYSVPPEKPEPVLPDFPEFLPTARKAAPNSEMAPILTPKPQWPLAKINEEKPVTPLAFRALPSLAPRTGLVYALGRSLPIAKISPSVPPEEPMTPQPSGGYKTMLDIRKREHRLRMDKYNQAANLPEDRRLQRFKELLTQDAERCANQKLVALIDEYGLPRKTSSEEIERLQKVFNNKFIPTLNNFQDMHNLIYDWYRVSMNPQCLNSVRARLDGPNLAVLHKILELNRETFQDGLLNSYYNYPVDELTFRCYLMDHVFHRLENVQPGNVVALPDYISGPYGPCIPHKFKFMITPRGEILGPEAQKIMHWDEITGFKAIMEQNYRKFITDDPYPELTDPEDPLDVQRDKAEHRILIYRKELERYGLPYNTPIGIFNNLLGIFQDKDYPYINNVKDIEKLLASCANIAENPTLERQIYATFHLTDNRNKEVLQNILEYNKQTFLGDYTLDVLTLRCALMNRILDELLHVKPSQIVELPASVYQELGEPNKVQFQALTNFRTIVNNIATCTIKRVNFPPELKQTCYNSLAFINELRDVIPEKNKQEVHNILIKCATASPDQSAEIVNDLVNVEEKIRQSLQKTIEQALVEAGEEHINAFLTSYNTVLNDMDVQCLTDLKVNTARLFNTESEVSFCDLASTSLFIVNTMNDFQNLVQNRQSLLNSHMLTLNDIEKEFFTFLDGKWALLSQEDFVDLRNDVRARKEHTLGEITENIRYDHPMEDFTDEHYIKEFTDYVNRLKQDTEEYVSN